MGVWSRAKEVASTFSVISWVPATIQVLFPTVVATVMSVAAAYRDWIWNDYGMLGILSVGLCAGLIASGAFALAGIGFRAFRASRQKLDARAATPTAPRTISGIQLVPSEQKMSLVVTPARGGVKIGMFVEISTWTTSIMSAGWSEPARFYLGEVPLRAAQVKFSHSVMEYNQEVNGWLFEILQTDGSPSGTRPCFVHGKMRVIFMFADQDGIHEKFPFLLVRSPNARNHPIVLTRSDFPQA